MAKKEMDYSTEQPQKGKLARKLLKIAVIYILLDNIVSNYAKYRKKRDEKLEEENADSAYKTYDFFMNFMNSKEIKIGDERFSGANIKNCLGGVNLDLQELKMNSDVFLHLTNVFGGISIKVPYGVNVKCDCKCLFGGVSNMVPEYEGEDVHTIYIEAKITFGGLAVTAAKSADETVEDMFEESVLENLSKQMDVARESGIAKELNKEEEEELTDAAAAKEDGAKKSDKKG